MVNRLSYHRLYVPRRSQSAGLSPTFIRSLGQWPGIGARSAGRLTPPRRAPIMMNADPRGVVEARRVAGSMIGPRSRGRPIAGRRRVAQMSGASDRTVALVTGAARGSAWGSRGRSPRPPTRSSWPMSSAISSSGAAAELTGAGYRGGRRGPGRHPGRTTGPASSSRPSRDGGAGPPGQLRGISPRGTVEFDRRGPLGAHPRDQPQGRLAGDQGGAALLAVAPRGRSSTSARCARPGPCRACSPTSSARPGSGA